MSKAQAEAFYKTIAVKPELKQKVMAIKGNTTQKLAELAQEEGYDATKEDFVGLLLESDELKLPDEALNRVAAGNGCMDPCSPGHLNCAEVCGIHLGHLVGHSH